MPHFKQRISTCPNTNHLYLQNLLPIYLCHQSITRYTVISSFAVIIIMIMKNAVQIKLKNWPQHTAVQPTFNSNLLNKPPINNEQLRDKLVKASYQQNNFDLANIANKMFENKLKNASSQANRQSARSYNIPSIRPDNNIAKQSKNGQKQQDNANSAMRRQQQTEYQAKLKHYELRQRLRLTTMCFQMVGNRKDRSKEGQRQADFNKINNKYHKLKSINSQIKLNSFSNKHKTVEIQQIRQNHPDTKQRGTHIRIQKRNSQQLVPKSKISIKNIDSTFIENKLQQKLKRNNVKSQRDQKNFLFFRKENYVAINLQSIKQAQIIKNSEVKQFNTKIKKKHNKDNKIPDFIKLTLQNYYNQPQEISSLQPISNHQQAMQCHQQPGQEAYHLPMKAKMGIRSVNQNNQQQDSYDIVSNKIQIASKLTKNGSQSSQLKRRKKQYRSISIQNKSRVKKDRHKQEGLIYQICAWQMDPQTPQDLCLKL